jgi:hypothetical protein
MDSQLISSCLQSKLFKASSQQMTRFPKVPPLVPPYDKVLSGLLCFRTFADCEATLRRLEDLRRHYLSGGDKKGVEQCRAVALLGRNRAEAISRNKRVRLQKRDQKRELANWFRIWLENPGIFLEWLPLRKDSQEFRSLLETEKAILGMEE